ncbi:MAG: protein kinase [Ignavibacteriae bacterium]|nr:protein kinase [Ignavibacteriota bacterium]
MIGRLINHYRIIEKLGSGGMGVVYKAFDEKLNRFVALKFLPSNCYIDDVYRFSIISEARTSATLEHPNICNIHEVVETDDNQVFIVMAYYEGETLKQKIENKSLEHDQIVNIIFQILNGLQASHEKGIIHRDIKPANIFITNKNEVKILDFGLAKNFEDINLTSTESTSGTFAYMSPEQIKGENLDHRTDIWSFGVLLYELISNKKPFNDKYEQSTLFSILNDEPNLTEINKNKKDKLLEEIIIKCLDKNKELRFQSVDEIIKLLKIKYSVATKSKIFKFSKLLIATAFLLIISIIYFFASIKKNYFNGEKNYKQIAILFKNSESSKNFSETSLLLQSLLSQNLINYENIKIIDPISMNGLIENLKIVGDIRSAVNMNRILGEMSIDYYLVGTIISQTKKNLQTYLIKTDTKEIIFSKNNYFETESELPEIANKISNVILDYFQIQKIDLRHDKDLQPFIQGTNNLSALKSFLIASEFNYKLDKVNEEKYLKSAISLDSTFISPRIWLIPTLIYRGEIKEAIEQFRMVKNLEQKANRNEQIMIKWAEAYVNKDIENQIKYLKLALEYMPRNNIIMYNLAYLYCTLTNYNESIYFLEQIMEMKWNFPEVYTLLGFCYTKLKMYSQAIKTLENSFNIKPVNNDIYLLLKIAYNKQKNLNRSNYYDSLYFENIKKEGVPLIYSIENSANYDLEFGETNNAINSFKTILDIEPNNLEIRERIADLYLEKLDTNLSIIEYFKILQLNKGKLSVYLKLGKIFDKRKDTLKALQYYKEYIKVDSTKNKDSISNRIRQLK